MWVIISHVDDVWIRHQWKCHNMHYIVFSVHSILFPQYHWSYRMSGHLGNPQSLSFTWLEQVTVLGCIKGVYNIYITLLQDLSGSGCCQLLKSWHNICCHYSHCWGKYHCTKGHFCGWKNRCDLVDGVVGQGSLPVWYNGEGLGYWPIVSYEHVSLC